MFEINSPFEFLAVEWDASDALAFYSVLLGAGLAIWGVYLSIQYAQKSYKDDVRNRVLPFFSLNVLAIKYKRSGGFEAIYSEPPNDEGDNYYEEYIAEESYFTIKDRSIVIRGKWTEEQNEIVYNLGHQRVKSDNGSKMIVKADYRYWPVSVKNIGLGSAVLFQIEIKPKGNDSARRRTTTFTMTPTQEAKFYIYIDGFNDTNFGEYVVTLHYCDIYENRYEQVWILTVESTGTKMVTSGFQKLIK